MGRTYGVPRTLSAAFVPPTALQVRADPLSGSFGELGKLSRATVDDCLYLLLGLLRDRHDTVEVFVDEQPHEHLRGTRRSGATLVE